jgi:hypothetical protein
MIRTFWRWKQVLTIRKWCLEREKKKEKKEERIGNLLWVMVEWLMPEAQVGSEGS